MKKLSAGILIIGIVMLAVGLSWNAFFVAPAEGPWYLAYHFKSIIKMAVFCLIFGGSMTAVWGLAGLLMPEQIGSKCHIKTSAMALGVSAVLGLGLYCANLFFSCYFLSDPSEHPIRLPVSMILGIVCLLGLLGLLYLYKKVREKNFSKEGIVRDVILVLSYVLVFFCLSGIGYDLLRIPMMIQRGW